MMQRIMIQVKLCDKDTQAKFTVPRPFLIDQYKYFNILRRNWKQNSWVFYCKAPKDPRLNLPAFWWETSVWQNIVYLGISLVVSEEGFCHGAMIKLGMNRLTITIVTLRVKKDVVIIVKIQVVKSVILYLMTIVSRCDMVSFDT